MAGAEMTLFILLLMLCLVIVLKALGVVANFNSRNFIVALGAAILSTLLDKPIA